MRKPWPRPPSGCSRSRSLRKAAARSAAISPPTPAAPRCSPTATPASSCSGSKWCWPTDGSGTASPSSRRTTPATTSSSCSSAPKARSGSSPRRCSNCFRAHVRSRRRLPALLRRALALLNLAEERAGGAVTSFELMPRIAVEFALRHGAGTRDPLGAPYPWYVLIELSSAARDSLRASLEELLATAAEHGLLADAAIAASIEQAQSFWHLRNLISETQRPEGGSIKHDVSVPVAAVPEFIEAASAAVQALIPCCR